MPINVGLTQATSSNNACLLIKEKLVQHGFQITQTRFRLSSVGYGYVMRIPVYGNLFVRADHLGRCKISVPTDRGRRYITKDTISAAITAFMSQYGINWANAAVTENRRIATRNHLISRMKGTLERILSNAGMTFNDRRCMAYPETRSFIAHEVEYQVFRLVLAGTIDNGILTFTNVEIRQGVTNVKINKLMTALAILTGQRQCPV